MRMMLLAMLAAALPISGEAQTAESLFPALQELAAHNDAEAIYHLGMAYHTGAGVAQDRAKALVAFRKAAALGDPLAAYKLGCYYSGQGEGLVPNDEAEALKYKLVAAEAGYALAQPDVSAIYYGRGDLTNTLTWLGKAVAQGWPDSLSTYAALYDGVPGVPRDAVKAAAYFQLSLRRADLSQQQRDYLATLDSQMTPEDLLRARALISAYRPHPTDLTLKGLSGQRAALALIGRVH